MTPVVSSPATRTNSPATKGSTPQEIAPSTAPGKVRALASTRSAVTTPARKVGRPSANPSPDETRSTTAVAAMPSAAIRPALERVGTAICVATLPRKARRCVQRNTA